MLKLWLAPLRDICLFSINALLLIKATQNEASKQVYLTRDQLPA